MILSQLTTNKNVLRNVICLLALFVWCASCASFAICEVRRGHPPKIIARSPPIPLATKVLNFLDPNLRFLLYTCEDYLEGLAVKKVIRVERKEAALGAEQVHRNAQWANRIAIVAVVIAAILMILAMFK